MHRKGAGESRLVHPGCGRPKDLCGDSLRLGVTHAHRRIDGPRVRQRTAERYRRKQDKKHGDPAERDRGRRPLQSDSEAYGDGDHHRNDDGATEEALDLAARRTIEAPFDHSSERAEAARHPAGQEGRPKPRRPHSLDQHRRQQQQPRLGRRGEPGDAEIEHPHGPSFGRWPAGVNGTAAEGGRMG